MVQRAQANPDLLSSQEVLQLQSSMGNQAVQRLLQSPKGGQSQFRVGPMHDRFEAEADRVAGESSSVQRSSEGKSSGAPMVGPVGGALDGQTSSLIQRVRGHGQTLDASVRAPMEKKLQMDFSPLNVHVNEQSDHLNDRLGSRGFTVGSDMFIRRSEYQPSTTQGRKLLHHEMTHYAQQSGQGTVQRKQAKGLVQRKGLKKARAVASGLGNTFEDPYDVEASSHIEGVVGYLNWMGSQQGGENAKASKKQHSQELESLLHISGTKGKGTNKQTRDLIRQYLLIARSKGTPLSVLKEAKAFMLATFSGPDNLKLFINNDEGVITRIGYKAETNGYSKGLINLLYSGSKDKFTALNAEIDEAEKAVEKSKSIANQVLAGGNKANHVKVGLRTSIRAIDKVLMDAKGFSAHRQYIYATDSLGEARQLNVTVNNIVRSAQVTEKSPYQGSNETGQSRVLGGGAFSKVSEIHYDPGKNTVPGKQMKITHGVFKPEKMSYKAGDSPSSAGAGIAQYGSNFSNRSVASSKVDKLLGLGITAKTKLATHGQQFGTMQEWSKGQSPKKSTAIEGAEGSFDHKMVDFNYDDPEIQRQLATLQILDIITGQTDRHTGNYFIYQGPGGTKVTAIDNDLSFGKNKGVGRLKNSFGRDMDHDNSRGMPLFVDAQVADQILATTPQQMKAVLDSMLEPDEVAAALHRFAEVKTHLRKLQSNRARLGRVQQQFDALMSKRQQYGGKHMMSDTIDTQLEHLHNQWKKIFAQGAVLNPNEWGEMTSEHSTYENSYYGVLRDTAQEYRKNGDMVPVE